MKTKDVLENPFMLGYADCIQSAWLFIKKCEDDTNTPGEEVEGMKTLLSEMKGKFLEKVKNHEERKGYGSTKGDSETTTNGPE